MLLLEFLVSEQQMNRHTSQASQSSAGMNIKTWSSSREEIRRWVGPAVVIGADPAWSRGSRCLKRREDEHIDGWV